MPSRSLLVLVFAVAGCVGGKLPESMLAPEPPPTPVPVPEPTVGDVGNTFDHLLDERDPFDILKQKQEEGSPLVAARLHSCQKITYVALGNLLASRGVDLKSTAANGKPKTAGQLYREGAQALGAPNYAARTREPTQQTTAGATKLMDVFVQAAPEIIANLGKTSACKINGQPIQLFQGDDCTADGITCLSGAPATAQHVKLCNQMILEASSKELGRQLAVAAILAAAHSCE